MLAPVGGVVGKLGIQEPALLVFLQPYAQPWPGPEQDIVGNLDVFLAEDYQPLAGERLKHGVHLGVGGVPQLRVKIGAAERAASQFAVPAGHGQVAQDLPGEFLAARRQPAVHSLRAGLDGAGDTADLAVAADGQPVAFPFFPGQRHRLGQQRQHSRDVAAARLTQVAEDGVDQPGLGEESGGGRRAANR